jgi:hypothetical protein
MDSWVAPHLTGGLGNRLFEFAATLGLAEKWNTPCVFYLKSVENNDHGAKDSLLKLFPGIRQIPHSMITPKALSEPKNACFVYCPFPSEQVAPFCIVEGWRQTDKYFPKAPLQPTWSMLIAPFTQVALQQKYSLLGIEDRKRTWFIHVRLGDYKILPHHQIPIVPYYQKCLDKVPAGSKVLLFSDEPELCKEWMKTEIENRGLQFQICDEKNEVESLWLMSHCLGGAITANSTFSWWGAYFARNRNPVNYKAFYPSVWGQGLPPATDVVPSWGITVPIVL